MFTVPRLNVFESDAGFSIEILGRIGMRYREGDRSLFVDSEVLAPGKGIAISATSIRAWDPPYDQEPISPEMRILIIKNIKKAMDFQNQPLEVLLRSGLSADAGRIT